MEYLQEVERLSGGDHLVTGGVRVVYDPSKDDGTTRLSPPHFGPPASHTRIPDQSSGRYSSSGNQRRISGHGVMNDRRKAGSIRKAEESSQKNLQAKNPENSGAGTVALFITESLKHRKVPNVGL
ncbi:hypothetical protein CDL15_Pgr021182 [Punica granatum]|uniref:Uncharacterized protein n=1 Tax=Punica granatum TaxID=22663 RepID=A0A218VU75_PUNGR|nr:hypothetical protein CDL15_Pgr021182 [Punica granatum]